MTEKQQYGLGASETREGKPRLWYGIFWLLQAFVCMSVATQRIAEYFSHHAALGKPFFANWYAPWSVFIWQAKFPQSDTYGFMETAITHSQAFFLIPQFLILGTWLFYLQRLKGNQSLHGSARWASEKEVRLMGYLEGAGVYVGGYVRKFAGAALLWRQLMGKPVEQQLYLRHNGPEHLLVFAPTRSGKGVGLILPTLLA
jgi:type IV secretion system protein VirD4